MSGTFSASVRPRRPGAYFNFVETIKQVVPPSQGNIVALGFTNNWGPLETPVVIRSLSEYELVFGDTATTEGYFAARQAFLGEGVGGRGGAGTLVAFRMAGTTAAKATRTLLNATVNALTLTAVYEGTYANSLSIVVRASATAGFHQLVILRGAFELEVFEYASTDITALAAQISQFSDYFDAVMVATGTALATGTFTVTGGNDGATLAAGDFTAVMSALETIRFGVFAFANFDPAATYTGTPGSTILTSIKAWVQLANRTGKRFMYVQGGALGETAVTATARSLTLNDPNIVNVGIGTVTDTRLGNLSTAQLAPRIAGIIAARGEAQSLTYARFDGLTILTGAADTNILQAFDTGTLVLTRDSYEVAPVRIEKALTTFTTQDAANGVEGTKAVYSVPKFILTMHGIERESTQFAEQSIIGQVPVNDATRLALVSSMQGILNSRVALGILQPKPLVSVDPSSTDDLDYIDLNYEIKLGRSLEQVFGNVRIG